MGFIGQFYKNHCPCWLGVAYLLSSRKGTKKKQEGDGDNPDETDLNNEY